LDLVDHHEAVMLDETGRIVSRGAQRSRIVEQADDSVRILPGGDPGQGGAG
jgi:hypothetical protein